MFQYEDQFVLPANPRKEYVPHSAKERTSVHWGQRKLILSEIQFFTLFWDPSKIPKPICVYAGAASGAHIPLLSTMFPALTFECYDPRPFAIKGTERIKLHRQFFTNETAQQWSNRPDVFFISDIRSADYEQNEEEWKKKAPHLKMTEEEALARGQKKTETQVWDDMKAQETWVMIMNPAQALLKFRLPYPLDGQDRIVDYLNGYVMVQAYPSSTSTETRLVPTRDESGCYHKRSWSILAYEQQLCWHNAIRRETIRYKNPFTNDDEPIDGADLINDYDSCLETFILSKYLAKMLGSPAPYDLFKKMCYQITSHLNQGRPLEKWSTLAKYRAAPVHSSNRKAWQKYKLDQAKTMQKLSS